jgi:hypothetical protein
MGAAFAGSALGCWLLVRVLLLPGFTGGIAPAWKDWAESVPGYGSLWLGPQLFGASQPDPATSLGGRLLQWGCGWIFKIGPLDSTAASILSLLLFAVLVVVILQFTLIADSPGGSLNQPDFDSVAFPSPEGQILDRQFPLDQPMPGWPALGQPGQPGQPGQRGLAGFVTDKVAPLTLALLAAVLLSAKTLPVQASLLLLPLIALSGLRWRDHLIWAGTELAYFVGVWLYIAGESVPNHALPAVFYLVLLAARLSGIAWIGAQAVLVYRAVDKPLSSWPPVDRVPAN